MGTYIMLTRLSPDALKKPQSVGELNKRAEERIKKECPDVKWLANYAVLGLCDYVDISLRRPIVKRQRRWRF